MHSNKINISIFHPLLFNTNFAKGMNKEEADMM